MIDQQQPDLTGEQERQEEAATGGIEVRAAVLEMDADDDALDTVGESGDAQDDDDDAVEDPDDADAPGA